MQFRRCDTQRIVTRRSDKLLEIPRVKSLQFPKSSEMFTCNKLTTALCILAMTVSVSCYEYHHGHGTGWHHVGDRNHHSPHHSWTNSSWVSDRIRLNLSNWNWSELADLPWRNSSWISSDGIQLNLSNWNLSEFESRPIRPWRNSSLVSHIADWFFSNFNFSEINELNVTFPPFHQSHHRNTSFDDFSQHHHRNKTFPEIGLITNPFRPALPQRPAFPPRHPTPHRPHSHGGKMRVQVRQETLLRSLDA